MAGQSIDKSSEVLQRDVDKWKSAEDTLTNYRNYISRRDDPFALHYIDLLFVSNYKGGNSIIGGTEQEVNQTLTGHSKHLRLINSRFHGKSLQNLSEDEFQELNKLMYKAFEICKDSNSFIKGFGIAYCAALYHMQFPILIPLIDRRVLINSGIVDSNNKKLFAGTQVKHMESYYQELTARIYQDVKVTGQFEDIRAWDRYYFIQNLTRKLNEL
ncbi:hypothetical protein GCM10023187_39230 [Nibrella viscosa]|uniref:Uncharacterized protein n=1 Tax=Nibrella viscosa TaxID=1084524 RepID=A0ABP8KQ06_9BACT